MSLLLGNSDRLEDGNKTAKHPDGPFLEDVKTGVREQHVLGSWMGIDDEKQVCD